MATLSGKSTVASQLRALGRLAAYMNEHPYRHPIELMSEFFRLNPAEKRLLVEAYESDDSDPLHAPIR